jgi:hypothetical protein
MTGWNESTLSARCGQPSPLPPAGTRKENAMSLFSWAESKIRTFTVLDVSILKVCLIAFALLVAKLWPGLLALDWYWYGLIFAVTYIWVMIRLLTKQKAQ